MNCQSDAMASSISRAAWARTRWCAGDASAAGAASQNRVFDGPQAGPGPFRFGVEPHAEIAVGAPRSGREMDAPAPPRRVPRCWRAVAGVTDGVRTDQPGYTSARKSTPSNHQWPNSSVSNGTAITGAVDRLPDRGALFACDPPQQVRRSAERAPPPAPLPERGRRAAWRRGPTQVRSPAST